MWNENNLYLNGPFAPQHQELDLTELEVVGTIPPELSGTLYRITASPLYEPLSTERYHWFDGDGMVIACTFRDGKVRVRNRYVETAGLRAEREAGRALYAPMVNGGMGIETIQMPGAPPFKNAANTSVTRFADRVLVFTEVAVPHEMKPDSLDTVGMYDFGSIEGSVTAHWKIDPDNGDMLFYGSNFGTINWYRANTSGQLLETYSFDVGIPCMVHDFTVTKNHAIFFINPSLFDFESMAKGRPFMIWDPDINCRVAVMHRKDGSVQWFDAPSAFSNTHFLNAWQEGDELVVDGNRAPSMGVPKSQLDDPDPKLWGGSSRPWRWRLNLVTGAYKEEQMSDINCDMPRHNERLVGKPTDIGYYSGAMQAEYDDLQPYFDRTLKHNSRTGKTEFQNLGGELTCPTEPIFVPRPGGSDEDDGWVMNLWWDKERDRTELVVLNAKDFSGEPAARIKLPYRLPVGTHGSWVAD